MPSPFPGMDPYLEGELWSNFHNQLAVEIARNLTPKLVPRYVAVTEKYQNVVGPEEIGITLGPESVIPDVTISINHVWVKILDLSNRLLVTAIEVLSPTNKKGHGRRKYLKKRRRLLLSQAHLMEIELLRSGHRVPMADPLPDAAYFIFLCRAGQRPATQVWPVPLDQALPIVTVPLLKGDPDVGLNLQQVFDAVFDLGGMAYLIDYGKPPDVPLAPDWAGWADDLLRAAGMRSPRRARRS
jgi:hypothetical protein